MPVIRIESPVLHLSKSLKGTNLAEGIVDISRSCKQEEQVKKKHKQWNWDTPQLRPTRDSWFLRALAILPVLSQFLFVVQTHTHTTIYKFCANLLLICKFSDYSYLILPVNFSSLLQHTKTRTHPTMCSPKVMASTLKTKGFGDDDILGESDDTYSFPRQLIPETMNGECVELFPCNHGNQTLTRIIQH